MQLTPKKSLSEYMNQTTTAHTPTRFQGKSTSPARSSIHLNDWGLIAGLCAHKQSYDRIAVGDGAGCQV